MNAYTYVLMYFYFVLFASLAVMLLILFIGKLKRYNPIKSNIENPKFIKHRNIANVVTIAVLTIVTTPVFLCQI